VPLGHPSRRHLCPTQAVCAPGEPPALTHAPHRTRARMHAALYLPLAAGALTAAGGLFGYARAKSVPSLVAGVVLGSALLAGGRLIDVRAPTTLNTALPIPRPPPLPATWRIMSSFRHHKCRPPAGLPGHLDPARGGRPDPS
jgi:hypothetical protein